MYIIHSRKVGLAKICHKQKVYRLQMTQETSSYSSRVIQRCGCRSHTLLLRSTLLSTIYAKNGAFHISIMHWRQLESKGSSAFSCEHDPLFDYCRLVSFTCSTACGVSSSSISDSIFWYFSNQLANWNASSMPCQTFAHLHRLQRGNFTAFRAMGAKKPRIVMHLLEEREVDGIVLSDTDVVWLRRPHKLFAQHTTADVLVSTDCLSHQVEICLLCLQIWRTLPSCAWYRQDLRWHSSLFLIFMINSGVGGGNYAFPPFPQWAKAPNEQKLSW